MWELEWESVGLTCCFNLLLSFVSRTDLLPDAQQLRCLQALLDAFASSTPKNPPIASRKSASMSTKATNMAHAVISWKRNHVTMFLSTTADRGKVCRHSCTAALTRAASSANYVKPDMFETLASTASSVDMGRKHWVAGSLSKESSENHTATPS